MRIKLRRGFQKRLVFLAKPNLTWKMLAQKIGVNECYLKNELKNEKIFLSDKVYSSLCTIANVNYDQHILEKLDENWGRAKGGRKAKRKKRKARLLVENPSTELAELIGIVLGDGNLWVKKEGYYYIRICGDSEKDRDYLINYVNPLFESLFKMKLYIRKHNKSKELFLVKGSKDVVFTLNHFGVPSGDKKRNNIKIPCWILDSKEYTKACIRGLIDTDGSVFPITGRNYPYIWFSSNIPNLRKSFEIAMKNLGFKLSKWNFRKGHAAETYIANKIMIERFFKEICFSNKKHLKKFQGFMPR